MWRVDCVSSGLGQSMSLRSPIFLYIHLRKTPLLLLTLPYLRYLIYILTEIKCPVHGSKTCF